MASDQTVVAQFSIVNGVPQEDTGTVWFIEPRRRLPFGRRKEKLYFLLEPVGSFPHPEEICQRVAETMERTFFRGGGSVTFRLWQAVRAANKLLFEWNLEAPTDQRGVMGISCVALRGSDMYLLQAGPALAYLVRQGTVERFPASSPWLSARLSSALSARQATALGWRREIEPDLFYQPVGAGDMILLCGTNLVRLATDREIVNAIAYQDPDSALRNLELLVTDHTLSAMAIQIVRGVPPIRSVAEAESVSEPHPSEPAESAAEQREPGSPESRAARVRPRMERDVRLDLVGPPPEPMVEEELGKPAGKLMEEPPEEAEPWQPPVQRARRRQAQRSWAAQVVRKLGEWALFIGRQILPARPETEVPVGKRARRRRKAPAGARIAPSVIRVGLILLAVSILVVALVLWNNARLEQARQREIAELLLRAESEYQQAQLGEPEERRAALARALSGVAAVLEKDPTNNKAKTLREAIEIRADEVNKVVRLPDLIPLRELEGPCDRLLLHGLDLYLLDRAKPQVLRYTLQTTGDALRESVPEGIWPPAATQGLATSSKIVDIARVQADSDVKLVLLAPEGVVWERREQRREMVARPLLTTEVLASPQAIDTYYDAPYLYLYILDPGANLIRKYQAIRDGYSDAPLDYPAPGERVDLRDAVDLVVDGNIYILLSSGKIVKLRQGRAVDFPLSGLDRPLERPVAIATSVNDDTERGYLFVADAGNQRIVQFDKQGNFVQQFMPVAKARPFDDLRDVEASEGLGRLLVVNGSRLYSFALR